MNNQFMFTLCSYIMLVASLLTALGGIGSFFYKNRLDAEKEQLNKQQEIENKVIISPKNLKLSEITQDTHFFKFSLFNNSPEVQSNIFVKIYSETSKFDYSNIFFQLEDDSDKYLLPSSMYNGIYPGREFSYVAESESNTTIDNPSLDIIRVDGVGEDEEKFIFLIFRSVHPQDKYSFILKFFNYQNMKDTVTGDDINYNDVNNIKLKVVSFDSDVARSYFKITPDGNGYEEFNIVYPETFTTSGAMQLFRPINSNNKLHWLSQFSTINEESGAFYFEQNSDILSTLNNEYIDIIPLITKGHFVIHLFRDRDNLLKMDIKNKSGPRKTLIVNDSDIYNYNPDIPYNKFGIIWADEGYCLTINGQELESLI